MEKLRLCLVVSVEFKTFFFCEKKKRIGFFDCFKGDNDLNASSITSFFSWNNYGRRKKTIC